MSSAWEIWEIIVDPIYEWLGRTNTDTIIDLFLDFHGSALAVLLYTRLVKPLLVLVDESGKVISIGYE